MKKKRKTRCIYDKYLTIDNLYESWKIVKRTCKNRREVYYYSLNINSNLMDIYNKLKNRTYIPDKFRCFMIFEPKARLVMSQSVRDKIVNHFITNYYLIPYLESSLIDSNVATRKNKGTSYANKLVIKYLNRIIVKENSKDIYVLKVDISKYFYNINHEILFKKLEKDIYDIDVINLIKLFVRETNKDYVNNSINRYNKIYGTDIPRYINGKGLSIGAVSSQFLAIYYGNDMHHYLKEELGIKYLVSYMDDYLIIDTNKDRLKIIWNEIEKYLNKLRLDINKKSNIYRLSNGFCFLGYKYRYINNRIVIGYDKKKYNKIKNRLKYLEDNDMIMYNKSKASYYGYFKKIKNIEGISFKMKLDEVNNLYKDRYKDYLIIIKDGSFYKSLYDDGKIIWYIFGYKYLKDNCSFGSIPYDKVMDKLKSIDISFVVVSKNEEIIKYNGDNMVYDSYYKLAKKAYDKYEKKNELIDKVKIICEDNDSYNELNGYVDKIMERIA